MANHSSHALRNGSGREVGAEERGSRELGGLSRTLSQKHINTVSGFFCPGKKNLCFGSLGEADEFTCVRWDTAEMRFGVGSPRICETALHSIAAVQTEHDEGGVSQLNVVKKQLLPYLY